MIGNQFLHADAERNKSSPQGNWILEKLLSLFFKKKKVRKKAVSGTTYSHEIFAIEDFEFVYNGFDCNNCTKDSPKICLIVQKVILIKNSALQVFKFPKCIVLLTPTSVIEYEHSFLFITRIHDFRVQTKFSF